MHDALHVSVSIARRPAEVYEFASDPRNLPRWAAGLARSEVRPDGDEWVADAPFGKVRVRFAPRNSFGVMDHDVTLESGVSVHNPMRVVPKGSEFVFTLIRRPGMSDGEFAQDKAAVENDLKTLKDLLDTAAGVAESVCPCLTERVREAHDALESQMTESGPDATASLGARVRDAVSEAIRYWEPRRLVYNAILALVVLTYFVINWPYSRTVVSFEGILGVFVLAVLANVCYCAAYLGDVFVQVSGFRETWLKWRWVVLVIGIVFAAIITRWFAIGFFTAVVKV